MENKFVKSVVLGISAMVGFVVTEKVYDICTKAIDREREKNLIEMEEIPFEELPESE